MHLHTGHAFAALALGTTLAAAASGQVRHHGDFNLNFREANARQCADLRPESSGEIAQTTEAFTLSRGEAPVLEVNTLDRGHIRVFGEARADFAVEACKFAVAADRGTAEQLLRGVTVSRSAGRLSTAGPESGNGEWATYLFVRAPKDAPVDLETRNGAIGVQDLDGQVKLHATNGPIAVHGCTGRVEATSVNGPIAFEGGGGDVHLVAQNGPISVKLSGDFWNGNQLEAETQNGPLSLKIPDSFRSGVRVETDGHSPMSCRAAACQNASTDLRGSPRVIQMNGSNAAIRVSTHNGPIAIGEGDAKFGSLHRIL